MNILITINIRWFNAEAAYAYSLAQGLKDQGHQVTLLGLPASPVIEKASCDGFAVIATRDFNSYNPLKVLRACWRLFHFLKRSNIDVVNMHRSEGMLLIAAIARLANSKIRVVRTRGDQRLIGKSFFNRWIYGSLCHHIIASADVIRQQIIDRLGLHHSHVSTIRSGIDTQRFVPARAGADPRPVLGWKSGNQCVAMVARLDPIKGHDYFLQAAKTISQKYPATDFFIFSYDVVEDRHEGNVHWIATRANLNQILPWMDIAVIASISSEVNCRVALEWMASAKPLIGTRIGVIPELIHDGVNGFVIEPGSSQAIVDAVSKLITDPELARKMGQAGHQQVLNKYTIDRMTQLALLVFDSAST